MVEIKSRSEIIPNPLFGRTIITISLEANPALKIKKERIFQVCTLVRVKTCLTNASRL